MHRIVKQRDIQEQDLIFADLLHLQDIVVVVLNNKPDYVNDFSWEYVGSEALLQIRVHCSFLAALTTLFERRQILK